MLTPSPGADALIQTGAHRLSKLWRIKRVDAEVFRFTDHDAQITFEGEPYDPAGGGTPSASRSQGGLNAGNFDSVGPITSDKITVVDLERGLWRDAEVTQHLVDWTYPQAGSLRTDKFWFTETEWDGEQYAATLEGIPRWLQAKQGLLATRNCPRKLGEGRFDGKGCTVDIDGLSRRNVTVASITTQRLTFVGGSAIPVGHTRERYRFGFVEWNLGANEGEQDEIKDYTEGSRIIELFLPTSFDITTADRFDLIPGCDKLRTTCNTEYTNILEYGGFPYMPGTNRMLLKPRGTSRTKVQRVRTSSP